MGKIVFTIGDLYDCIIDIVAIKSGIVLSQDELIEILNDNYSDEWFIKEKNKDTGITIRSEVLEALIVHVRIKIGDLQEENVSTILSLKLIQWEEKGFDIIKLFEKVNEIITSEQVTQNGVSAKIDPIKVLNQLVAEEQIPYELGFDIIDLLVKNQIKSNHISQIDRALWDGGNKLIELFNFEILPKSDKEFIEQKFINYLAANPESIEKIHWRNFERLTAEFFKREGYDVELGPGSNDGGIDIRVYKNGNATTSLIVIQCKRYKSTNEVKIETVKAFYTDVVFEGAEKGVIVTTSRIEPGGKKVCKIRKYPIEFAENENLKQWVTKMKKMN